MQFLKQGMPQQVAQQINDALANLDRELDTMEQELGGAPKTAEVRQSFVRHFCDVFERQIPVA